MFFDSANPEKQKKKMNMYDSGAPLIPPGQTSLVALMIMFICIFGLQPEVLIIIILHAFGLVPCLVRVFVLVGILGMDGRGTAGMA